MVWTPEQRAKQSARASLIWVERVRRDPQASKLAKARRGLRDLSQRELASLAGCSSKTVSEAERGANVGPFTRERLARVLALPPQELFDR
jgi:DNA-binding XRE family transcriptional regulator